MNNTNITVGAQVVSANRESVGMVEQITETAVRVKDGDRIIEVPFGKIDLDRSSVSKIILMSDFEPDGETLEVRTEELHTNVREVERSRVRIDKSVEYAPFQEDIELGADVVNIERVPGGEEFDEMPKARQDGDKLIIPVIEEVLVLTRRYRVVEEIHVTRHREMRTERVAEDLRREVVTVHQEETDDNINE